jgi:transposase
MRKRGVPNKEVAELVGLPPQTTSEYYSRYRREGEAFFRVRQAGKPKKSGQKLSDEEQAKIVRLLVDKNPRQLQFRFALWTREAVRQLIKQELGKELPISTVGDYLSRWKFTSKKPIKRAYERKDEKTRQWLEEEYPKIKKAAREEEADIWWADETSCVSLPTNLKGYAPIGSKNKPVLIHPARKFRSKRGLVDSKLENLSVTRQCVLIGLNRSSFYYHPVGLSSRDLSIMRRVDRRFVKRIGTVDGEMLRRVHEVVLQTFDPLYAIACR